MTLTFFTDDDDGELRASSIAVMIGSSASVLTQRRDEVQDTVSQPPTQLTKDPTATQSSSLESVMTEPAKAMHSATELSPDSVVSIALDDYVSLVTAASKSRASDVTATSYASATGALPSATQSLPAAASNSACLPDPTDSFTTAPVEHVQLPPADICMTLCDFDARATPSNQTVEAKISSSRQLTESAHSSAASSATASPSSSYVTVASAADVGTSCDTTPVSCTTHQPDSACKFPMPAISDSSCAPTISPASKTDVTTKKPRERELPPAEETHDTETTTQQDTKRVRSVSFAGDDDDDEEEEETKTPVRRRRPTTFVRDLPRDSSQEAGLEVTERPRSQPNVTHHPETLTPDASSSSLPTRIAVSPADNVSEASPPAAVTKTPSLEAAEDAPLGPLVGHIERKSDNISSHVSTFVPSLPDHDTHSDQNVTPALTLPTTSTITVPLTTDVILPPTTDAEPVTSEPMPDTDAEEQIETPSLSSDVPEGEDEDMYPDVEPEALDEPLPLAYDSPTKPDEEEEDEREVEKLEEQSDALSMDVDRIGNEKVSTLEPQRAMPEIVYMSLHGEKRVKEAKDNDSQEEDADVERKAQRTNYELPPTTDYNRQKSPVDRVVPAPPSASETGIAVTLSDYDLDDDNLTKKIRMSTARKKEVAPRFSKSAKKSAGKGKSSDKTAVTIVEPQNVWRSSDVSRPKLKKKRDSTFVEDLLKRRSYDRSSKKVTIEEPSPPAELEVPERQQSLTLISALNKECTDIDESEKLHVASRPSSRTYRYIVSPDAQYAGGRSLSRSSVFQPVQCRLPTDGTDKATVQDLSQATKPGTKPQVEPPPQTTQPSSVLPSPTDQPASPASTSVAAEHRKTDGQLLQLTLADLDRDEEDAVRRASSRSSMRAKSQVAAAVKTKLSDADAPSPAPILSDEVISFTLDSYDAYDDVRLSPSIVIKRVGERPKMEFPPGSDEPDDETQTEQYNTPVDPPDSPVQSTNSIDDLSAHTEHPASVHQASEHQAYEDQAYEDQAYEHQTSEHQASGHQASEHKASGHKAHEHQTSDNVVAEVRTSPEGEHEKTDSIDERNLVQVASRNVAKAGRVGVPCKAVRIDHASESRMPHSDSHNVESSASKYLTTGPPKATSSVRESAVRSLTVADYVSLVTDASKSQASDVTTASYVTATGASPSATKSLPEKSEVGGGKIPEKSKVCKTREVSDEEAFKPKTSHSVGSGKTESCNRPCTLLTQMNTRKNK